MLELLVSDYRPYLQDGLAVFICLAALMWGAGPERVLAVTWLFFFEVPTGLYRFFWGPNYQLEGADPFLTSIDTLGAACLLAIALNANRNYPLFVAALQVLAMSAHFSRGLIESIAPIAYAVMLTIPGWVQILVFGVGLLRHVVRERRYGPYRDWRAPVDGPLNHLLGKKA